MGGKTSTTSSTSQPPAQVLANYTNLTNQATNLASQPLQQYSGPLVAGFTPQQQEAFNTIENSQGISAPYINAAAQMAGNASAPINPMTVGSNQINQYLSPYIPQVVGATEAQQQNQNAIQNQQLVGNAIQSGAWGGDRSAVAQGILANQENLANAPVIANLYNTGYGQALGEANVQQQANIGAQEASGWLGENAGFALGNLGQEAQSTALTGAQSLLSAGGLQQQLAQEQLNIPYEQFAQSQAYPWQVLGQEANIESGLGGLMGGTSSTTSPGPSGISTALGLGELGVGIAGLVAKGGRIPHRDMGGNIALPTVPDVSLSYLTGATTLPKGGQGLPKPPNPVNSSSSGFPNTQGLMGALTKYENGNSNPAIITGSSGPSTISDITTSPSAMAGATGGLYSDPMYGQARGGRLPHMAGGGTPSVAAYTFSPGRNIAIPVLQTGAPQSAVGPDGNVNMTPTSFYAPPNPSTLPAPFIRPPPQTTPQPPGTGPGSIATGPGTVAPFVPAASTSSSTSATATPQTYIAPWYDPNSPNYNAGLGYDPLAEQNQDRGNARGGVIHSSGGVVVPDMAGQGYDSGGTTDAPAPNRFSHQGVHSRTTGLPDDPAWDQGIPWDANHLPTRMPRATGDYARGGVLHRDTGGTTSPIQSAGASQFGMPAGGGNPAIGNLFAQFAQMQPEQLQQLAVRFPPSTPQGALIQQALQRQRMNTTAGSQPNPMANAPQTPSMAGATVQTPQAGMAPNAPMAPQMPGAAPTQMAMLPPGAGTNMPGSAPPSAFGSLYRRGGGIRGFDPGGAVSDDARSDMLADPNTGTMVTFDPGLRTQSTPVTVQQVPTPGPQPIGGAGEEEVHAHPDVQALESLSPPQPTEARAPAQGDLTGKTPTNLNPIGGVGAPTPPPARAPLTPGKNTSYAANPWMALVSAGLGTLASRSPFPGVALGEGGLQGAKYLETQEAAEQNAQTKEDEKAYRQQEIDARSRGYDLEAKTLADRIAHEDAVLKEEQRYHDLMAGNKGNWVNDTGPDPNDPTKTVTGMSLVNSQTGTKTFFPGVSKTGAGTQGASGVATAALLSAEQSGLTGDKFLATLPPALQTQVKGLADGRLPFPSSFALGKDYWQHMLEAVSMYDPTFDAVNYSARSKTRNDFTSGTSAKNVNALNTLMGHIETLKSAGDSLNNGDFPSVNHFLNWVEPQLGVQSVQSATSAFQKAQNAVADELERVFRGTSGSLEGVRAWREGLSNDLSPTQQKAAIDTLMNLVDSRVSALGEQYSRGMGKSTDGLSLLSPQAQQSYRNITGRAPESLTYGQRGEVVGSAPPQAAIDHLKSNPGLAPQFDEMYGKGEAEKILRTP